MWLAIGFTSVACLALTLMGSVSLHSNRATYHREHPTVVPDSVVKTDGKSLCYVTTRMSDHNKGGDRCTEPLSDQGWCYRTRGWSYGFEILRWYYTWPSFCFRPYLDVRLGNYSTRFMKDCGTSLECMYSFNAPTVTYTLGYPDKFSIGTAHYRIRPEEIVMLVVGGVFGAAALIMFTCKCIHFCCEPEEEVAKNETEIKALVDDTKNPV
jgi:hypothetical protein